MTSTPGLQGDLTYWKLLAALGCGGFAALALFVAMPELDLMVAAAFFDGRGFGRWADEVAVTRQVYTAVFVTLCGVAGAGLALALATRGGGRVPLRLWLFAAAVPALGPGLLANVILKENWGRARPATLEMFGGDLRPSLPFEIAGECDRNCSFVSGEGASAAAVLVVLIGLFGGRLTGWLGRGALALFGGLWLTGATLIRMVPGRHFLSDTLFAFVLVGLVGMALYALLGIGRWRGAGPGLYLADLGRMGRRLVRGSSPRG
jgi:lipid A 4'-phosphatase